MPSGHAVYTVKKGDTLSQVVDQFKKGNLFDVYYKVDKNLTWEKVWDDKKNIPLARHAKKKGEIKEGDIVYLPYIGTELELYIPFGKQIHLALYTGDRIRLRPFPFVPVVDIHMHVQSLHATPLPIMYNTAYFKTYDKAWGAVTQKTIGQSRYEMTDTSAGFFASLFAHDFGKIGRFSTDLIARIFMQEAKNNEVRQSIFWVLKNTDEEVAKVIAKCKKKKKNASEEAGSDLKLEDLCIERRANTDEYYKGMTYYFDKMQVFQIACMMPMDLTYAHFWGHHGLPIYIPDDKGDGFYYISDFLKVRNVIYRSEVGNYREINVADCYEPFFNKDKDHTANSFEKYLSYDLDLRADFDNYVSWVLTDYISNEKTEKKAIESLVFSFEHERFLTHKIPREDQRNHVLKIYKPEIEKKYKHFIRRVNGDNSERFEDYYLQHACTEASAFKYPLQLIPFYHYDPRRYYLKDTDLQAKAKKIAERHAFFNIEAVASKFRIGYERLADITMSAIDADYIYKNVFIDKKNTDFDGNGENIIRISSCKPHEEVIKRIYPNGPCVGVKMYPPLGYPPNLYENPHKNDVYTDRQFDNLLKLFEHCEKNHVPVTAHCSPIGMTIADGFNYMFRDSEKRNNEYPVRDSALYVDKICSHPDNWMKVIERFPGVKLNLAHFGGMEDWYKSESQLKDLYGDYYYNTCTKAWKDKIAELAAGKDNVYTDISCYTFESLRDLPHILTIGDMDKVESRCDSYQKKYIKDRYRFFDEYGAWYLKTGLTDVEKYQLIDILELIQVIRQHEQFRNLAGRLKDVIQKHSALKEKILMGSDWYMSELSGLKGTGAYYGRMFELLRFITKELDAGWDVWHQFAVVNTLGFLGFLQTDAKGKLQTEDYYGKKAYIWDKKRIETYLSLLENVKTDEAVLHSKALSDDDITNFKKNSELRFEQLMHAKIFAAEEIKNAKNKLVITSIVS